MGILIWCIVNGFISEFVEALTDYDDSDDKWYSAGLFFRWPTVLGKYIKKYLEAR